MLTLHLTLTDHQISVRINGKESHQFSLLDLHWLRTEADIKDFVSNPKDVGANLFQALFKDGSPARAEFDALSKQSERTIALVLESPELDGVAWEYAYNKSKEEYVVEDCAFVRALPEKERPANGRMKSEVERVPLLFIPANPLVDLSGEPTRALDVEGEWQEMKRHIEKSVAPFDMLELRPATPEALQSVMARFQNGMIAHFSGHGAATRDGAILLFERENGASNPLEAREFVREIKDKAWICFLSACQSAVPERTEFSNLARELAKAGVPFALGMQFNLPDPFAPNISGQFYNYLAHGHAVPEAARQARRAVKRENEFFVGMIALYAAHPDEVGKLVWRGVNAQTVSLFRPADVSDLPSPASGLIGRQRELMRIGTRLLEGKKPLTVTLHGAGGIGKTALLWQALLRFAPSFELTLAIGLDPLPSLESVLGRIERFLGLPSPCSNDTKEREALVRNALMSKRTLLGLDNFETLNHALNDDGTKGTAKSLYAFFKSMPAAGVTLCVTSREKTNLPGEHIEEIYGLEDAMGGALFYENVSTRKDALNEAGLERLSAAVGGHPLALRLLAPIFEEQAGLSLEQFIEKLQIFLPKASDQWTEQERHESLGACFAFSMDNLPKNEEGEKLQVAISRLSVFSAFFVDFTAAPVLENRPPKTNEEFQQMLPNAKSTLHALWERGLLERTLLLMEDENFPLYRLHPALGFFARERLTETETIKENYWKSMSNFVGIAEEQITKSPIMARISFSAIPDLLAVAKAKNDKESALMQFRISKLLRQFGLYDDSMLLLEKSRDTYQALNQPQALSGTLHEMGIIFMRRGDWDEAMKLYQQALQIEDGMSDSMGKSTTLHEMAIILFMRDDLDEAMNLYQQSLDIKRHLGDLQGLSATLHGMAGVFVRRGDLDGAMKLYQESLEIKKGLGDLQGMSANLHEMADIFVTRGDLDEAMKLYQQSLQIAENLGDLRDKSATLHDMAIIFFRRGDSDTAMDLYLQALDILEKLGDLQGKSIALSMIGQLLVAQGDYPRAIQALVESLQILSSIGDRFHTKRVAEVLVSVRQKIGVEIFDNAWKRITDSPISNWLTQESQQDQGMTAEQFIAGAIQSAREKRPEAEEYFKSAQKMAADSSAPKEVQELGSALQRIMLGDKNVDLSGLPEGWAELIKSQT
ncbi:MAG: tetratricopeptide repeat protein [Chloroflexi bacterium]|nr:tetratricopeptide repeat protein [Chloroflexota bacterium]